jgi:hypothetical protein
MLPHMEIITKVFNTIKLIFNKSIMHNIQSKIQLSLDNSVDLTLINSTSGTVGMVIYTVIQFY